MYLSQAFSSKNKWVYTLVCIAILFLLFPDKILGSTDDSQNKVKEMVEQMGELPTYFILLSSFAIFLLPLFSIVKNVHNQSITKFTTSRKKIDFKRILFSVAVFGTLNISYILIEYLLNPSRFEWNFQPEPFLILFLISIFLLPIQIGFEEYFFRGYFMQWLSLLFKNKWVPFFTSSILFGLAHIANPEVDKLGYGALFFYISAGFSFGIIALMDEGLELALGMHFINNLTASLLLTSDWTVFQTPSILKDISEPSISLFSILSEVIIYIIVIFIFAKKYQWNNWKEKLFGKVIPQNEAL